MNNEFELNIERAMKNLTEKGEKALAKRTGYAIGRLYEQIFTTTPRRTGALQKAWEIDWGQGFKNPRANFAQQLESKAEAGQYKFQDVTIRNQLHYAYYIEYGHSKQAPHGMMRVSAAMFGTWL
mgnify:CR=1 FL=1